MKALIVLLPWFVAAAAAAGAPDRIVLNFTAQPHNSVAVTWRTAEPQPDAAVEFAPAGDTAALAATAIRKAAGNLYDSFTLRR